MLPQRSLTEELAFDHAKSIAAQKLLRKNNTVGSKPSLMLANRPTLSLSKPLKIEKR